MRHLLLAPLFAVAACAAGPSAPAVFDGEATARLGQVARLGDVSIRPMEIVEDSRCPVDVQCVWAGRLIVQAEVRGQGWSRTEAMELGRGIALEDARSLRLVTAEPRRRADASVQPADYRLTFTLGPGD